MAGTVINWTRSFSNKERKIERVFSLNPFFPTSRPIFCLIIFHFRAWIVKWIGLKLRKSVKSTRLECETNTNEIIDKR